MRFVWIVMLLALTACKDGKRYHENKPDTAPAEPGNFLGETIAFQKEMNALFRDPETSPLPDRYRKDFTGLEFFEPDSSFRVKARLERTPEALPFLMPTTTGREAREVRYGFAHFSLNGKAYRLELYQDASEESEGEEEPKLFLPFLDDTNGWSTYDGGRYLDLEIPKGDTLLIDFNRAYNPYCAYNKKYSCPIVPRVNYIDTEIKAGVMDFEQP